jgi:glycosyltransferase involved in cell wall biosynthesis
MTMRSLTSDPTSRRGHRGLAAFRSAHEGADIVVCGCGRSLRELETPAQSLTIGVNDVGRLFDPTYLVVVNPRGQFTKERFAHIECSNAQALFTQLDLGRVRPPVVRFTLGTYGGTDVGTAETLHFTQNSPYVAVCLAAYMGARRIGLIGVDLTEDHFFARTGRHALAGRIREIDAQYGRLARALACRGVQLINLSSISRLTSLARATATAGWAAIPHAVALSIHRDRPKPHPEGTPMKVSIDRRSGQGLVGQLLEALAASASALGHSVLRDTRATAQDPRVVSVVWNGRRHYSRGPTLYCEHGWLPRSAYQISPAGINAGSHLAPFEWDGQPLPANDDAALDAHIAGIRAASFDGYYQYMQAGKRVPDGLPREFLLVPLQIESDTNIVYYAPALLRSMQALVDHIARTNPPWPVIFKQHPMDARHGNRHLRLTLHRREDLLWPQTRGNIHQLLQSGACRGVITINSNVAHDGLLWNVPAVVLGKNVWPSSGPHLPFLTAIPRDWSALAESVTSAQRIACRRAYAHFLMTHQWTLADARNPDRVAGLLAGVRSRHPSERPRAASRPVPKAKPRLAVMNVVAENRGWLFEAWKRAFAAASLPGFDIAASDRPLRHAAGWIFIRAKEAVATPDPRRTVVQLHDLLDGGAYRANGARACVARCAGVSLTHPDQQDLLAASGVDLNSRRWILQPVGWGTKTELTPALLADDEKPSIAWIGRPSMQGGADVSRLDWFVEAAASLRDHARVTLIGEKLNGAAATLRRAGIDCRVEGLDRQPLLRAADWIGRFDAVVISGGADTGPWPLFDALYAGVPVVSASAGWATRLLADGACGRIADSPAAMGGAIRDVLSERSRWRQQRTLVRSRVAEFSLATWVEQNLTLAAELASREAVHEVA